MIGNFHRGYNATAIDQLQVFPWVFEGQPSDWNTQTITIPATSASATPNPTPTPTVPEFSFITLFPLFVVIPLITAMILRKSRNLGL
jgi:hypothetical protein